MTLTLSDIPNDLERALRQRADREGRTVDQVALVLLAEALHQQSATGKSDFSDIVGTWVSDAEVERALRDQDRVEPELWR